jgi:hypothetical protein
MYVHTHTHTHTKEYIYCILMVNNNLGNIQTLQHTILYMSYIDVYSSTLEDHIAHAIIIPFHPPLCTSHCDCTTGWTTEKLLSVSGRCRPFSFPQSIQTGYEAWKALYSEGIGSTFPRDKADGHETDHSLPSSTKVHY